VRLRSLLTLCVFVAACSQGTTPQAAHPTPTSLTGSIGAATYEIDVPANWSGDLLLWSHGYVAPDQPNITQAAPTADARAWLTGHGYAVAGSSYSSTGWALEDAFKDQMALLDFFGAHVGKPKRVIAWGASLGGLITAGLVQLHPDRFAAAMPLCGVLAGSVASWNAGLDSAYAFKTLLAPQSSLQLTGITNPAANGQAAVQIANAAAATPQGKARLSLVAALADLPGWFDPRQPEPAADDYAIRIANQVMWESRVDLAFAFRYRAEVEHRAGGNPSWNTGVDYAAELAASPDVAEVQSLYAQAGLNLQQDLRTLNNGPRIKADPAAAAYLARNITFDGDLKVPLLSVHTTGDGLVIPQNEQAYADVVRAAHRDSLLRQLFVHRAGHCAFTTAEIVAALHILVRRIDSGRWDDAALEPAPLNAEANLQGASANQIFGIALPPAYETYTPSGFPRPFPRGTTIPS
jgi:pimeloyl-ACP methyl ester carboxylesterase